MQAGQRTLAEAEASQAPYAGLTVASVQADVAAAWGEAKLSEQRQQQVRGVVHQHSHAPRCCLQLCILWLSQQRHTAKQPECSRVHSN